MPYNSRWTYYSDVNIRTEWVLELGLGRPVFRDVTVQDLRGRSVCSRFPLTRAEASSRQAKFICIPEVALFGRR